MSRSTLRALDLGRALLGALLLWGLFAPNVGCGTTTTTPKNTTVFKVNGSDPNGQPRTNGYRQLMTDRWGPFNGPGGETGAPQRLADRQAIAAQETGGTPSGLTEQQRKDLLYGDIAPLQVLYKDPGLGDVTLDYRVGTYVFTVPLLEGASVLTNDSDTAWLGEHDERIVFRAHVGATTVASDSFTSAIVLTGTQNLERLAAARGLLDAGSPRGLAPGLSAYLDSVSCNGTLSANHALVFFELDETDPAGAEYDFQDLVLFVDFTIPTQTTATGLPPVGTGDDFLCGPPPQPFVRDSIGPDSSATDNTLGLANGYFDISDFAEVVYSVPSHPGGEVKFFDVVAGSSSGSCSGGTTCYGEMAYRLVGWNSQAEAETSPLAGTLFDIDVTNLYTLTPLFGSTLDGGATLFPTSLLQFSTAGLGANCPAAGCTLGLLVDQNSTFDVFSIRQSSIVGAGTDRQYCVGCPVGGVSGFEAGVRFEVAP